MPDAARMPFTLDEYQVLCTAARAGDAPAVTAWVLGHIRTTFDGELLLWTLANTIANALLGAARADRFVYPDPALNQTWQAMQAMVLVAAAANDDKDTGSAVAETIAKSAEGFPLVIAELTHIIEDMSTGAIYGQH